MVAIHDYVYLEWVIDDAENDDEEAIQFLMDRHNALIDQTQGVSTIYVCLGLHEMGEVIIYDTQGNDITVRCCSRAFAGDGHCMMNVLTAVATYKDEHDRKTSVINISKATLRKLKELSKYNG